MTATLDITVAPEAAAPTAAVVVPDAPVSTRESRAAARAAMTEAERGQFKHGFAWLVVGLVISMGLFGVVALHEGQDARAASSVSSTTTP